MKKVIIIVCLVIIIAFGVCKAHAQNNFTFRCVGKYTFLFENGVPCTKTPSELKATLEKYDGHPLSDSAFAITNEDSSLRGCFVRHEGRWEMILAMEMEDGVDGVIFFEDKISLDYFSQKLGAPIHLTESRTKDGWRILDATNVIVLKG